MFVSWNVTSLLRCNGSTTNMVVGRSDHFRFGSVFIKKNNQTEIFFLKKNRIRTETGSNRPVSVRFGSVFLAKTGSNRFGSVFSVLARFFSVWLGLAWFFFRFFVGFSSVRFFVYKTGTEPAGFFKKLIGFFFRFGFFDYFFSGFLGLICFPVFWLTSSDRDGLDIGRCHIASF